MKRVFALAAALLVAVSLWGCGAETEQPETTAPATVPAETIPEETTPVETVPEETEPVLPVVEFPAADEATGTLKFYFDGKSIYAGGPVSDIIEIGVEFDDDITQMLLPGQVSGNIPARLILEDVAWADRPEFYFNAINPYAEARPVSECVIYGITVNMEEGIEFGSGMEDTPFVSGVTTREEIEGAYGTPDYSDSDSKVYHEIAYYEPFSTAFFSFRNGVVRQIMTCYSGNIHGELADSFEYELSGYFGNDAYILMSQYMDVKPYLKENWDEKTAPLAGTLEESILLGEDRIELGCKVEQMPEQFSKPYIDLEIQTPIHDNHYIRSGVVNHEEFYLINRGGLSSGRAIHAYVKGVITHNCYYTNWDQDNSGYFEFDYMGLKSSASIEDVLELFGQPYQMNCTSSPKACFVWMYYMDDSQNKLQVCVDPMTDQIVELTVSKYYPKETTY